MPSIPAIKVEGVEYELKDAKARDRIDSLESFCNMELMSFSFGSGYIDANTGAIVANAGSYYANINKVEPGDLFVLETPIENPVRAGYALYDSDRNLLKIEAAYQSMSVLSKFIIKIPEGCTLMRIGAYGSQAYTKLYKSAPKDQRVSQTIGCLGRRGTAHASERNATHIQYAPIPYDGYVTKMYLMVSGEGYMDIYRYRRFSLTEYENMGWIGTYHLDSGYNEIDTFAHVREGEFLALYDNNTGCSICIEADLTTGDMVSVGFDGLGGGKIATIKSAYSRGPLCFAFDLVNEGMIDLNRDHCATLFYAEHKTDDGIWYTDNWHDFACSVAGSYLYYDRQTWMNDYTTRFMVTTSDPGSKFALAVPNGGYYISIDLGAHSASIHKAWTGNTSAAEPDVLVSKNFSEDDFEFRTNEMYCLEVRFSNPKLLKLTITHARTHEAFSVEHETTLEGGHGTGTYPPGMLLRAGQVTIKNYSAYPNMPLEPALAIFGDSYSEGWTLYRLNVDPDYAFSKLIKNALGGDVAIFARGGKETQDAVQCIETDMALFKPKYAMIELGINETVVDGDITGAFLKYKVNITKMVEAFRKTGAEIILVTSPNLSSAKPITSENSFIKNYFTGFRYLDMGTALAIDDTSYTINQDLMAEDGHPNKEGHQKIFERFLLDFGELFAFTNSGSGE